MVNAQEYAQRYVAFINEHNLDRADEFYADDIVFHDPVPAEKVVHGLEGVKQFVGGLVQAFPDLHFTADAAYGEGDRIAWHGSLRGTMKNDYGPIPATGRTVEVPLAEFYRLEHDKIAEAWVFIDSLWLMQQLGVIPTPEEATV